MVEIKPATGVSGHLLRVDYDTFVLRSLIRMRSSTTKAENTIWTMHPRPWEKNLSILECDGNPS